MFSHFEMGVGKKNGIKYRNADAVMKYDQGQS